MLLNKESIYGDVPRTLKSQSKLQEENISNALEEIGRLEFISQPTCLIRVEHDLD